MSFMQRWIFYLTASFPHFGKGYAVLKVLFSFLPIGLGVAAFVTPTAWLSAMLWVIAISLLVGWLTFTAGMAVATAGQPYVIVGDLQFDDEVHPNFNVDGVFFFVLENGNVTSRPYVQIVEITGGTKLPER